MNWKKIFKYFFIVLFIVTLLFVFLANRDMTKIYGGLTEKVKLDALELTSSSLIIENISVLSANGNSFIPNMNVLINNGLIANIDSIDMVNSNAKIIDGDGKYLIPGLIDSHVHLFKSQNDLLLYVANGVTQIREMIGEPDHLIWRNEIRDGRIGPDMYIATPRLGSFGALEGFFMEWSQGFETINNAQEAKGQIESFHDMGYDAVKIYSHLNKESYLAINRVADSLEMDVVGHIPWSVSLEEIWASKQKEISHLEEIMNALRREYGKFSGQQEADKFISYIDEQSRQMVDELLENDISITTTLWLTESFVRQKFELDNVLEEVELEYVNPGISEWTKNVAQGGLGWLPHVNRYQMEAGLSDEELSGRKIFWSTYAKACQVILKNLSGGGVKIMAGTDANLPPTVPGFSLHDELYSMQQTGMTPIEVLHSATSVPAKWLKSNTGIIKEGFKANLILLNKNPHDDISHSKSINTVILGGRVLDRALLNKLLQSVKEANDNSRKIEIDEFVNASSG